MIVELGRCFLDFASRFLCARRGEGSPSLSAHAARARVTIPRFTDFVNAPVLQPTTTMASTQPMTTTSYYQTTTPSGPETTTVPGMNPCDSYPCGYDKQCVRTGEYDYYCRDDNNVDDVDLNCEQLSCRKHQSLCSYAEWRVSFFGKGLKQLMDHRDKYYPNHTELTVPPCTVTENMIQCKNANMKACHESVIPNCPVCYCMDHKYQNARQVVAMWNGDQHLWANVNRVWMNIMQDKTC